MLPYEFQWISECDSTSRIIKDRHSFDKGQLKVVAAARQTAGVGRLGRRWLSSEGNLHFSIGIPASYIPEEIRSIIPLAAGVIVSQFIRANFGVNICLKWPNDLILDGKKVGGILCEATILDAQMQGVVIGVGINITKTPDYSEVLEYPAGSLSGETSESAISIEKLARTLAQCFAGRWSSLTKAMVLKQWAASAMSRGHMWYGHQGEQRDWYKLEGVAEDGNLNLVSFRNSQSLIVNSSNHELKWDLQMGRRMIVADIGNTRTKVAAVIVDSDGSFHLDSSAKDRETLAQFIQSKMDEGFAPVIHCLSVNPSGLKELEDQLRQLNINVRLIDKKPIRLSNSKYDFEALGVDRWAILEMLYYRQSRSEISWPAVVISCGTATTIDCVDVHGCHLGGYIMAGIQTAIDALAQRGALLPKSLNAFDGHTSGGWPTSSSYAIIEASIESTSAFLMRQRERLAKIDAKTDLPVSILMTGGYSQILIDRMIIPDVFHDENLVLFGAALLALNGR